MDIDSVDPRNPGYLDFLLSGPVRLWRRMRDALRPPRRDTGNDDTAFDFRKRQPRADRSDDSDMLDWELPDDGPPRLRGRGRGG